MKRRTKIFLWTFIISTVIILIIVIGIPTRLIDKNIDEKTFNEIKIVQKILSATKDKISLDSMKGISPLAHDEYGYINTPQEVDKLFSFLPNDQRQKIKNLFANGQVKRIDIMRPRCIQFYIRSSPRNFFFTSSWQTLLLTYNDSCVCTCQDNLDADGEIKIEDLKEGWYKVLAITKRRLPEC
ncbi:hypothetical protein [Pinibacter soli]|uniref:Uncharacterized protein n=1 Tax=Pinibacter soli TaxID=3044211 RepID=A0ABT6R9M7_9BACT|nr:hypothetical protein [Pinibacter soli]MDI3319269.1 hypothetical protein [Pinibacter soli]